MNTNKLKVKYEITNSSSSAVALYVITVTYISWMGNLNPNLWEYVLLHSLEALFPKRIKTKALLNRVCARARVLIYNTELYKHNLHLRGI
jgi:hypothetical protein